MHLRKASFHKHINLVPIARCSFGQHKELGLQCDFLSMDRVLILDCQPSSIKQNRPFAHPVTWYEINYAEKQITQWDFPNKGKSGWTGKSSFVLKVPLCYLRPSIIHSVPYGRIVQKAYYVIKNLTNRFFTITAEILPRSLAKLHCQHDKRTDP